MYKTVKVKPRNINRISIDFRLADFFLLLHLLTCEAVYGAGAIKAEIVFSYFWNKGLTGGAITVALYWQQEADFPESLACAISFPRRLKRFAFSSVFFWNYWLMRNIAMKRRITSLDTTFVKIFMQYVDVRIKLIKLLLDLVHVPT